MRTARSRESLSARGHTHAKRVGRVGSCGLSRRREWLSSRVQENSPKRAPSRDGSKKDNEKYEFPGKKLPSARGLYLLAMYECEAAPRQRVPTLDVIDLDTWRAAAAGDQAAFHALIDRHGPHLFKLALSLSGRRHDAEDICQETFIAAFHGLQRFDGRASVRTWLSSILVRRAASIWRKERRSRRTLSLQREMDSKEEGGRADPGGSLADQLSVASTTQDVDRRLDILEVIRSLPTEFRDVVVLREIQGMSYQEIADVLAVPRGTVESRLYRGRAQLRRKLGGY